MYYPEMIGKRIGSWTVLRVDGHGTDKKTKMVCRCDCGATHSVDAYSLYHGLSMSCGHCNQIIPEGNHMRCIMKNGASFLFSREDIDTVKAHTWSITRGYARTLVAGKTVYFHRLIMGLPAGTEIDHINMDRLDNRRSNLRIATHAENQRNRRMHRDNAAGLKGVCQDKRTGRYFAYINADLKRTYLGCFDDKHRAAAAYDENALQLHGEFARPNFRKEETSDEKQEVLELDKPGTGRGRTGGASS